MHFLMTPLKHFFINFFAFCEKIYAVHIHEKWQLVFVFTNTKYVIWTVPNFASCRLQQCTSKDFYGSGI